RDGEVAVLSAAERAWHAPLRSGDRTALLCGPGCGVDPDRPAIAALATDRGRAATSTARLHCRQHPPSPARLRPPLRLLGWAVTDEGARARCTARRVSASSGDGQPVDRVGRPLHA